MKLKLLFIFSLLVLSFLSWKLVYAGGSGTEIDSAALQIRMRNIGHQLLLETGDSLSRVLPVKKVSNNTFQLQFEAQLEVEPDSLVSIVNASLRGLDFPQGYVVNVWSCDTREVVYGFEIYRDSKTDVVPCLGRSLPEACYEIEITFVPNTGSSRGIAYLIVSLCCSLFLGLLIFRRKPTSYDSECLHINKFQFFFEKQILKLGDKEIPLTAKETQVLKIFALNPNKIINRDELQKEVWENEGVVVGRSLDVFISKLRKKLELDPAVRIVNIHGKGYKLEID